MRPLREAAVLMAICARPPHRVLFIERAAHLRDHPGQIGLPGGSVDPADGDDRTRTALREVREELGIAATHVTIVARLPDVRQRVNTFNVSPLVGILRETVSLTVDPAETAAVFAVPLAAIVAPGAVFRGLENVADRAIETWVFDYDGRHIWGLTAQILPRLRRTLASAAVTDACGDRSRATRRRELTFERPARLHRLERNAARTEFNRLESAPV